MKTSAGIVFFAILFFGVFCGFSQPQGEVEDDLSDFKPISPEEFVENNFLYLKELFEEDPAIIYDGISPVKELKGAAGYRSTFAVDNPFRELISDAVKEWAKQSGYIVSFDWGDQGSGFLVSKGKGELGVPKIRYRKRAEAPRTNVSLEEAFRKENHDVFEERLSGGALASSRYSSVNGISAMESERLILSDDYYRELEKKKLVPKPQASENEWKDFIRSNANNYDGNVTLAESRFGGLSGNISFGAESSPVKGSLNPVNGMLSSLMGFCDGRINEAKRIFFTKMGIETEEDNEDLGDEIVVEVSAKGFITATRALEKRYLEASELLFSGHVTDKDDNPIEGAKVVFRGLNAGTYTDGAGIFNLFGQAGGEKPHSESMDIRLQKIALEITHEELGRYDGTHFGVVADGYTTLKFKVNAQGINPRTVTVRQPKLGAFVEQSMLNLPLVLDGKGQGEMEYVPPAYVSGDQLNRHFQTNVHPSDQYGLLSQIWVAEVPVFITYEDDEGNAGSMTLNILVCRPPIMLIHGFTGSEETWDALGNYLRGHKYETYAREYYQGPADESTIERQAEKLGFYIQKLRESYRKLNILQSRIDIVAHSMGGLISRYYISNMSKYGANLGIAIPYNVKLSREQLAATRYKTPVILNDVRKLIMVGTPNHGASRIDELFGVLAAVSSDYHQVASGQLRFDSEFLKLLNEGENEGRHLDLNVQYALLYGIRKRSEFYPPDRLLYPWQTSQKNFADDDGVVKVSSARLNGILNIPFPSDWYAINGYIHSLAVETFFMGDEPITNSTSIFEEIKILLEEDIKRTPLQNSHAQIINTDGDVFIRDFATDPWKRVASPIRKTSAVKLESDWCRLKTERGTASIGFFLDDKHWGSLHLQPNTIVYYEYASPEFVNVYLKEGKARFRTRKQGGGGFEVVMGEEGEQWYAFNPKARVRDIDTDFIVEEGDSLIVQSISGSLMAGIYQAGENDFIERMMRDKEGIAVDQTGGIRSQPLPSSGWWTSIDTAYVDSQISYNHIAIPPDPLLQDTTSIIPIIYQRIGGVQLFIDGNYLPVSGFSRIRLKTTNEFGEALDSPYQVSLEHTQDALRSFVEIANPEGVLNNEGIFEFMLEVREPDARDFITLRDVPLEANFVVKILHPETGELVHQSAKSFLLGMTLLSGITTGPDYNPRPQAAAPELYGAVYQIANQADKTGNFYILFNTTLFEKELEKRKAQAARTRQAFGLDQFGFYLQWPESCSLPLTFILPDTTLAQISAGREISIGRDGLIDLLSPEEQEQRIKYLLWKFIERMPLKADKKSDCSDRLESLVFSYIQSSDARSGTHRHIVFADQIEIPFERKQFWSQAFIPDTKLATVMSVMHAMGHFLEEAICTPGHRKYGFLYRNCSGEDMLWSRQSQLRDERFNHPAWFSFYEAGADFFQYLIWQYLIQIDDEFVNHSIYAHPGYSDGIRANDAITTVRKYPGYEVSGVQTAFLLQYYADIIRNGPCDVFADFLLTKMMYSELAYPEELALTINEWIIAKQRYFADVFLVRADNPRDMAVQYKLIMNMLIAQLVPLSDYSNASVEMSDTVISDFSNIPCVYIYDESKVLVQAGTFHLRVLSGTAVHNILLEPGSKVSIADDGSVEHLEGCLWFKAPFAFKTSQIEVSPNSKDFLSAIEKDVTTITVFEGNVNILSGKNEQLVNAGESTSIQRNGRIRKPRKVDVSSFEMPASVREMPFKL